MREYNLPKPVATAKAVLRVKFAAMRPTSEN
jgi:hypothetical protein